ncbi:hypothetical protein GF339_10500 [candidate division KSB3 bacterium]|uniref:TVP38/TMEM64 family membrane protein n=1 Tax=candidate division KSB3 bacterium TaxID=2044937 RepID=A0A9D5Q5U7_9BACT|nr:hypothetical protein [candidate division KSB3 bacterium]MBD3325005.1 hypothetical protein [candidate division KSB3 bacterium]
MYFPQFIHQMTQKRPRTLSRLRLISGTVILLLFILLAVAWQWTPLNQWLRIATILDAVESIKGHACAPLCVVGGYLVGSLAVVPLTVLVSVTVLVFGPTSGFVYSLIGGSVSALLIYGLGHVLGRNGVEYLAGSYVHKVSRRLAAQGISTMLVARILPLAPFTVINMLAGASHIRFRDYTIGSLLGMALNMLVITLIVNRIEHAVRTPKWSSVFLVTGLLGLVVLAGLILRWWLLDQEDQP